jgi:hypothetical protein
MAVPVEIRFVVVFLVGVRAAAGRFSHQRSEPT